ncbi:hypothetical protein [Campylobacter sp. 1]|uniref:hypothetical protein n=1 Tax=Campylobacter sp. 1 TaxID=2039344 RepID=UPI000BBBF61F|nr:hypothetical protein [Campylobacter sp. 1]PCH29345.1 hypothetical protein CPH95_03240 [Campylobacter sp. 1]
MKKASLEEWKDIAAQSKKARNELFQLINQTSGKVPTALNNQIIKAIKQLDTFRCQAEDRMMNTGASTDLHIFYGSND